MQAFLNSPQAQWIIWFAILAIVIAIGVYVVQRVRAIYFGESPGVASHLTDFRTLRERGELSDAEFRRIKQSLATRIDADDPAPGEAAERKERPARTERPARGERERASHDGHDSDSDDSESEDARDPNS